MKVKIVDKDSNSYKNISSNLNPKFLIILGTIFVLLSLIIKFIQMIIVPILVVFGFLFIVVGIVLYLLSIIKNNINLK